MRVATVLVFTALVCVTQAQLIPGFAAVVQAVRERVKELRNTIDEQLEKAEERLQSRYHQARDQIDGAYNNLEDTAEDIRDRVNQAVDNVQESIQTQVVQLAAPAIAQGINVTTCTALVQSFRNVGDAIINDTVSCVTGKVEQGKTIVTNVLDIGQESLDVITGIRAQSNQCVENIDSIKEQISAVTCLVSVGAKASWALATKVPAVAKNFVEAIALIYNLQPSLTFCMSKNSILALVEHGTNVLSDVRKCITNCISSAQGTNQPEVTEPPTANPRVVLPESERVPQN